VSINAEAKGTEFRFKSPVKNNEAYKKKVEEDAAAMGEVIHAPGLGVYEGDAEYVHVSFDHDTDEVVVKIDANTGDDSRNVITRVLLDYGMYSLKVDFDINQESQTGKVVSDEDIIEMSDDVRFFYLNLFNKYSKYDKEYKNIVDEVADEYQPLSQEHKFTVGDMKKLKRFYSSDKSIQEDLVEPLKYATNLESFEVLFYGKELKRELLDFDCLKNCTKLKKLYYMNNKLKAGVDQKDKLKDISVLSKLENLEDLRVNMTKLSDLAPITNLSLTTLVVPDNDIEEVNDAVGHMSTLERLDMENNRISDISDFNNLTSLKSSYLYNNNISDISSLSNLGNLEALLINGNRISDINPLKNMNLKRLRINENPLPDNYMEIVKQLSDINTLRVNDIDVQEFEWMKNFVVREKGEAAALAENDVRMHTFRNLSLDVSAQSSSIVDGVLTIKNPLVGIANEPLIQDEYIEDKDKLNKDISFKEDNIEIKLKNANAKSVEVSYPVYSENPDKVFGEYGQAASIAGNVILNISIDGQSSEKPESSYEFEDGVIKKYLGSDTEIDIPESIDGKAVVEIGNTAFRSKGITAITIPSSVTKIGMGAFAMNDIQSIELPTNIESIGNMAFFKNKLTSITIPSSLELIPSYCFKENDIQTLVIKEGVKEIALQAFSDNEIASLTIPASLESIRKSAFANNNLTEVTIPKTLVNLDDGAFEGNTNLRLIDNRTSGDTGEGGDTGASEEVKWTVADFNVENTSIKGFSDSGLAKFAKDQSIELPKTNEAGENITSVGERAFAAEKDSELKISAVVLPETLTSIGREAFRYNDIAHISFADGLESIEMLAFNGNKLEEVILPDSVTSLGAGAFTLNQIKNLKLSSNLEVIPTAFGYNKMTSVTIPAGVKRIDDLTFSDNELVEIHLPDTLEYLSGFNNNHIESVDIPSSVITLGEDALARNNMTSVVIPGNVKTIKSQAFRNTWHELYLESVDIQDGVETIESSAFVGNKLVDVNIPSSVTSLSPTAFKGNLGHDDIVHIFTPDRLNPNNFEDSKYQVINPAKIVVKYVIGEKVLKEDVVWKNGEGNYYHIGDADVNITPSYDDNAHELISADPKSINLENDENVVSFECQKKAVADDITIKNIEAVSSVVVDFGTSSDDVIAKLSKTTHIVDSNDDRHEVNLSWSLDAYNPNQSGNYSAVATFDLPDGVVKPSDDYELKLTTDVLVKEQAHVADDSKWTKEDFTYDDDIITGFSQDGLSQLESDKNLIIPKITPDGDVVEGIGENAFMGKGLVKVEFPDGISDFVVNGRAFEKNDIEVVDLTEGVKALEPYAFNDNEIKYLELPSSLKKIGNHAFADNAIVSVDFDEDIVDIALDRFSFLNNQIRSITVLKKVKKVHGEVFMGNPGHDEDSKVHIYTPNLDYDNINNWFENSNYHKVVILKVSEAPETSDVNISTGVNEEDIDLPNSLSMTLNNGKSINVDMTWTCENYDSSVAGDYVFKGSYDLLEGMSADKPEVQINVHVSQG
jgi:Leucine-rich repeat (LRR) protein